MRDLNDLFFFAEVVEHGGFAPAGRALGIPKSKLSRRVAALEERLGVRLIQRSTRRFSVTEIGQEYYRHCRAMLVEADAAEELIARNQVEPQGTIRMSCASAVLYTMMGDMVARFMAQCPRIKVQLEVTNRAVDLIREGYDLALRVRFPPLEDSDLVMKVLAISTQRLVASPRLLAGRALPVVPGELSDWPTVLLGDLHQEALWRLGRTDDGGDVAMVRHEPRLLANDMVALKQAAMQGVGVAALPVMMIHEELNDGRLVDVLPGWAPRSGIVHLAFPSRRGLLPAVRLLIDFLAAEFAWLVEARQGYEPPGPA